LLGETHGNDISAKTAIVNSDTYFNAKDIEEKEPFFFDPSDHLEETSESVTWKFDYHGVITSNQIDKMVSNMPYSEVIGLDQPFNSFAFAVQTSKTLTDANAVRPFLSF
jgi:hypothetical protein